MSQDLILYRKWVCLRLSRGLGAEAEFFRRMEWAFIHNRQHALKDIKESIKLSAKSESDILKFDATEWLKRFKSIDNFFRRTLGMRGVTLDWIYRDWRQAPVHRSRTQGDATPRMHALRRGCEGCLRCHCELDSWDVRLCQASSLRWIGRACR
jgi:hypothetical protein